MNSQEEVVIGIKLNKIEDKIKIKLKKNVGSGGNPGNHLSDWTVVALREDKHSSLHCIITSGFSINFTVSP